MHTLLHEETIVEVIPEKHFAKKCYLPQEHIDRVKKFIEGEKAELAENLHLLCCILEAFAPVEDSSWVSDIQADKVAKIYEDFDFNQLESNSIVEVC